MRAVLLAAALLCAAGCRNEILVVADHPTHPNGTDAGSDEPFDGSLPDAGCPVPCGDGCCNVGDECGPGGVCLPNCVPERVKTFCETHDADCGQVVADDRCGKPRTVDCGACAAGERCRANHKCEAICADTDAQFCARLGRVCGPAEGIDRCTGAVRLADECGPCPLAAPDQPPLVCDLASNSCRPCVADSDADFCLAAGKGCGALTAPDNCGGMRTVDCGSCVEGKVCDPDHVCRAPGAPANDDCQNVPAIVLGADGTAHVHGDSSGAFADTFSPRCASTGADVVYSVFLARAKHLDVKLAPSFGGTASVSLRTRCNAPESTVVCGDSGFDRGGPVAISARDLPPGRYFIWVDAEAGSANAGPFDLDLWTQAPAPVVNDGCAGATPIALVAGAARIAGETHDATDDASGTCAAMGGPDLVYSLYVRDPTALHVRLEAAMPGWTPAVYLRTSCAGASRADEPLCATGEGGVAQATAWFLTPGAYYLFVDGVGGAWGRFTLELIAEQGVGPPANDRCLAPELLSVVDGLARARASTTTASDDYGSSCGTLDGPDVVYELSLPSDAFVAARIRRDAAAGGFLPGVQIRSGCSDVAPGMERACGLFDPLVGVGQALLPQVAAGRLQIVVDGADRTAGAFELEVVTGDPATNESCASPRPLDLTGGVANVHCTTEGLVDDASGACAPGPAADLVYSFTLAAPSEVEAILTPVSAAFAHPVLYLRSDCGSAASELACVRAAQPGAVRLRRPVLAAGTWFLFVDGATGFDAGEFRLTVTATAPAAPPTADACPGDLLQFDSSGLATVSGDTTWARDDSTGSCASAAAPLSGGDVVYRFTLLEPASIAARVERDPLDTDFEPALYLRAACASTALADERGCALATSGAAQLNVAYLPAGTWYLAVDGLRASWGRFTLSVSLGAPVSNDGCARPLALALGAPAAATTVAGDTRLATHDDAGSCVIGRASDVVYALTLAAESQVDLRLETSSNWQAALYVRSACGLAASEVACELRPWSAPLQVSIPRLAAGTWYLWVDGATTGDQGAYTLRIATSAPLPAPANDACTLPQSLLLGPDGTATLSADTRLARDDYRGACEDPASPMSGPDLVYRLTLLQDSGVVVRVAANAASPRVKPAAYLRAACASSDPADELGCARAFGGGAELVVPFAAAGDYFVVVDGQEHTAGVIDLFVTVGPAVPNDACANPTPLQFTGNRAVASGDTTFALPTGDGSCLTASGRDLVYKISLPSEMSLDAVVTPGAGNLRPNLYLRTSCGRAADELGCAATFARAPLHLVQPRLAAGDYYLWLDEANQNLHGAFSLEVTLGTPPPVPANDTCGGATPIVLTGGSALVADDTTAANAQDSGSCGAMPGKDLVYRLDLAQDAAVSLHVVSNFSTSALRPALYVRSSCAPGDEIGCATSQLIDDPLLHFSWLTPGSYYVFVDGRTTGFGAFTLQIDTAPPVRNDDCAGAEPLVFSGGVASVAGDLSHATPSVDGSCLGNSGPDVVYTFTTFTAQSLSVRMEPPAGASEVFIVHVRSACGSAASEVGCSYSPAYGAAAQLNVPRLPAGDWFLWADTASSASGPFTLEVRLTPMPPPPSNDSCLAPQPVIFDASGAATLHGDTTYAANDYAGTCGPGASTMPGKDVVYAIALTRDASLTASLAGLVDPAIYLRDDCAASGRAHEAGCAVGTAIAPAQMHAPWLRAGVTYYLVVDSADVAAGPFTLDLALGAAVPEDSCAGARALGPAGGAATGDLQQGLDSGLGSCGGTGADFVYRLDLAATQRVDVTVTPTPGSALVPVVYVRSGCGDPTSEVAGGCSQSWVGPAHLLLPRLSAGSWYVWVDSAYPWAQGAFELQVATSTPPTVANDSCASPSPIAVDSLTGVGTAHGETTFAGLDNAASCANATGGDVVYSFSTSQPQRTMIQVQRDVGAPGYKPVVWIRSNCASVAAQTEVTCARDSGGTATAVVRSLPAGSWIVWVGGADATFGVFDLTVSLGSPTAGPAGESCFAPVALSPTAGTTVVNGTTAGAQDEARGSCALQEGADVVYALTLAQPQKLVVDVAASGASGLLRPLAFLRTDCGSRATTAELGCSAAAWVGGRAKLTQKNLAAGTYWLWIDSADAASGDFALTLTLAPPVLPPSNDTCAAPVALSANRTVAGDLSGAAADYNIGMSAACQGIALNGPDAVYTFTAPAAGPFTVTVTPTGFDVALWMSSAACGVPAQCEALVEAAGQGQPEVLRVNASPGTTYYFIVDSSNAAEAGPFTILLQ